MDWVHPWNLFPQLFQILREGMSAILFFLVMIIYAVAARQDPLEFFLHLSTDFSADNVGQLLFKCHFVCGGSVRSVRFCLWRSGPILANRDLIRLSPTFGGFWRNLDAAQPEMFWGKGLSCRSLALSLGRSVGWRLVCRLRWVELGNCAFFEMTRK